MIGLFLKKQAVCSILCTLVLFSACHSKTKQTPAKNLTDNSALLFISNPQIAEYIRNIYQDKNGHYWYGTNSLGVAHYNGDSIEYFSRTQGFEGHQITGMAEDAEQNIWFATDLGVVKYDWSTNDDGSKRFINYTDQKYFEGQRFWSISTDSKGRIWAGATRDIFRFYGATWSSFDLPYPEEISGEFITKATSWSIVEDKAGNMWFSTNGFGAYKYDGNSFTQYSNEDGLTDDSVDQIIEDSKGQIWLGTRHGGISIFDGESVKPFSWEGGFGTDDVCVIYEDSAGNIWFSSEGYGVFSYDGESTSNYSQAQGLGVRAVQTIFEDRAGQLWVGGGGGLYRLEGEQFVNVTQRGPWR